jgi:hypothetical protein
MQPKDEARLPVKLQVTLMNYHAEAGSPAQR